MYISFTAGNELCSKKKCTRQGQVCSVNENNQAECRCRDSCPRSDRNRVCGSDGITYPNRCHLDMTSCKLSYTITVVSNGTCGGESSLLAILLVDSVMISENQNIKDYKCIIMLHYQWWAPLLHVDLVIPRYFAVNNGTVLEIHVANFIEYLLMIRINL